MKVAVLGAGAMGCMIGSFFSRTGHQTLLVDHYKEHMDKIQKDGLQMKFNGKELVIPMQTASENVKYEPVDLVIILVKAMATGSVLEENGALIGEHTFVCTLQNGLGNERAILPFVSEERIIKGSLRLASRLIEPGVIESTSMRGVTNVVLGLLRENEAAEKMIGEMIKVFTEVGLEAVHQKDINTYIWKKAVNNICVNAVCGITGLHVREYLTGPGGRELLEHCLDEVIAVAEKEGASLQRDDVLINLYENTLPKIGDHIPSTAQDIMRKRPTEIDFLNGYISRQGQKYGIATPVNDTITAIVKLIESGYAIQEKTHV